MSEWQSNRKDGNTNNAYLSFDIESDGPCPSTNSMISIGIFVFNGKGEKITTFQRNIIPHATRKADPVTKKFWDKHPKIVEFMKTDQVSAEQCMSDLSEFYKSIKLTYKPTWMARPSAFDWQWVNTYYREFGHPDRVDIGYSSMCVSTLLWAYKAINPDVKWNVLMKELEEGLVGDHNPLNDAKCQAMVALNICDKLKIRL